MTTYVDVDAISIDITHISFKCPFCRSRYKRNGEDYKNAIPKIHRHGSEGKLHNRVELKGDHCDKGKFPSNYSGFRVHVTDNTLRK